MKHMAFLAALGLAAGAAVAAAQSPVPAVPQQHANGAWQKGGRGGGALLKGIKLTDAQKAQLKQLRKNDRVAMQQNPAAKQDLRQQRIAAIRAMLTPDQRAQFEKNLADMKAHQGRGRGFGRAS